MRGSPLLRLALVLAGLALLIIPLRRLTSRAATSSVVAPAARESETLARPISLILTSTSVPFDFTITHLGQPLWTDHSDTATIEHSFSIAFPKEGIDLVIEVQWPTSEPAALKIEADPGGSAVLFGTSTASDVFTFR